MKRTVSAVLRPPGPQPWHAFLLVQHDRRPKTKLTPSQIGRAGLALAGAVTVTGDGASAPQTPARAARPPGRSPS